jgi:hypothetical protein
LPVITLFDDLYQSITSLCTDPYGNCILQKFFELSTNEKFDEINFKYLLSIELGKTELMQEVYLNC